MSGVTREDRLRLGRCDRCGRLTPANQNGTGDLYTLPEDFGPDLRDEGSFCQRCIDCYPDPENWRAWLRTHRPV